jgi:Glycosyl hydrolases family 25
VTSTDDLGLGDGAAPEDDPEPRDHSFFDIIGDIFDSLGTDDASTDAEPSPDMPVTADGADPGPPYLFVDLYPLDLGRNPPWSVLVNTQGYVGAIIKAMEGTGYNDGGWFEANWPAVRDAGGDRYDVTWFRGSYLFLRFAAAGAAQADAYLRAIDEAGGWDSGDVLPVIDVELGGPKNPNRKASAQQIIDCTTACAERLKEQCGRRVMLYGRGAMRDLAITDHMGCDVVWNPAYTATMVRNGLQSWDLDDIALWQYCGDGTAAFPKLPHTCPDSDTEKSISVSTSKVRRSRLWSDFARGSSTSRCRRTRPTFL